MLVNLEQLPLPDLTGLYDQHPWLFLDATDGVLGARRQAKSGQRGWGGRLLLLSGVRPLLLDMHQTKVSFF